MSQAACPLVSSVLELVEAEPIPGTAVNPTTLLARADRAERWLIDSYLSAWLSLCAGLPRCDYPRAQRVARELEALPGMLDPVRDLACPDFERPFHLQNVTIRARKICLELSSDGAPGDRTLQWGVWARNVPLSVAEGFAQVPFLVERGGDGLCAAVMSICMWTAYIVSEIVTDVGVAEEVQDQMFEVMPRVLADILLEVPVAAEA